jgi:hypothetical protein
MSEQRESEARPGRSGTGQQGAEPADGGEPSAEAQRQLAEKVAARVYDLLCRDVRLERERQGTRGSPFR